jgi:hypothetical protein
MAGTKFVTIHFPQFCCINVFVNSRRLPFISVERRIQIVKNEPVKQPNAIRLRKSRSLEQVLYVATDSDYIFRLAFPRDLSVPCSILGDR